MGIDPMADDAGQQGISSYHAMACNPLTLTDPLGLYVKGEAHNGGGAPDFGMEMLRRFPTMPNFMARYLDFGERTASQSMAEQQQMAAERIKKYYEEATTGGGNAQETAELGKGLNYAYDGVRISEGVENGLDYNQVIFTDKKGKTRALNIGNVKLKKNVIKEIKVIRENHDEEILNDLHYYNFQGNESIVKGLFVFLSEAGRYEWSLVQYQFKNNPTVFSRIATSRHMEFEAANVAISKQMELSDVNGSFGINYLIMYQETHSHVIGESAPSVYDINAEQLIRDRLSDARRFIDPEFNIIRGAIYYFR